MIVAIAAIVGLVVWSLHPKKYAWWIWFFATLAIVYFLMLLGWLNDRGSVDAGITHGGVTYTPKDNHPTTGTTVTPPTPLKANPSAGDLITLLKPVTVQYRPYWSDPARHSVRTITLPAGTKVEFMSRDGDNLRFYLADPDYEISVDATDIKN